MEPRPFARLSVGSLALRFRSEAGTAPFGGGDSSAESKFSCRISLSPFKQSQTVRCVPVLEPLNRSRGGGIAAPAHLPADSFFYLDEAALQKLAEGGGGGARLTLKVMQDGAGGGGAAAMFRGRVAKCVGKLSVPLRLEWLASGKQKLIRQGWATLRTGPEGGSIWQKRCCVMVTEHTEPEEQSYKGGETNSEAALAGGGGRRMGGAALPALHLIVKADLDPRFVFEFEAAPDQSPQILHVQGHIKQPIFSCKFARSRNSHSRGALSLSGELRSIYPTSNGSGGAGSDRGAAAGEREDVEKTRKMMKKKVREKKGWVLLIHDLSGKAVAAASMVTPFVPTASTGFVSRASPGAWLILRASDAADSWQPWARLEAWHEPRRQIACRLLLPLPPPPIPPPLPSHSPSHPPPDDSLQLVSQCSLSLLRGGDFAIDAARLRIQRHSASSSPFRSPCHSGNLSGYTPTTSGGIPAYAAAAAASAGFVMSTSLRRRGGKASGVPSVQIALRHISSLDDAAVFVALAAAVQLSVEACASLCQSRSFLLPNCLP